MNWSLLDIGSPGDATPRPASLQDWKAMYDKNTNTEKGNVRMTDWDLEELRAVEENLERISDGLHPQTGADQLINVALHAVEEAIENGNGPDWKPK